MRVFSFIFSFVLFWLGCSQDPACEYTFRQDLATGIVGYQVAEQDHWFNPWYYNPIWTDAALAMEVHLNDGAQVDITTESPSREVIVRVFDATIPVNAVYFLVGGDTTTVLAEDEVINCE